MPKSSFIDHTTPTKDEENHTTGVADPAGRSSPTNTGSATLAKLCYRGWEAAPSGTR